MGIYIYMNIKKDLKKVGDNFPQELILPQFGDNPKTSSTKTSSLQIEEQKQNNECPSKDTSYDAIRQINCREDYNNFAKNLHPDRNYLCPEDANKKFKELNR